MSFYLIILILWIIFSILSFFLVRKVEKKVVELMKSELSRLDYVFCISVAFCGPFSLCLSLIVWYYLHLFHNEKNK